MQGVRREVLQAQADATGLPLLEAPIPAACDNDTYEAAMARTLAQAGERWPGLRTAAFGDLLLEDIRAWRQAQCARVGWDLMTRSEEHTSELQSLMRIPSAVFAW